MADQFPTRVLVHPRRWCRQQRRRSCSRLNSSQYELTDLLDQPQRVADTAAPVVSRADWRPDAATSARVV